MSENAENFGQSLRRLRLGRGWSLRELAAVAKMSKTKLHLLEGSDGRHVAVTDAAQLDEVLCSGGTLTAAASRDRSAALQQSTGPVRGGPHRYADLAAGVLLAGGNVMGVDAMQRRTLLRGAALGLAAPPLALEATRHGLGVALVGRLDNSIDEWHEIVREHGYGYQTTAPQDLVEPLMVDMLALQYAVPDDADGDAHRELRGVAALLAALTAMTLANLGQLNEGRRWWRTARQLADRSGDLRICAWVRGREVVRALYEHRPIGAILRMVADAEAVSGNAPRDAMPELIGGKAQALAIAGRAAEATACLQELNDLFTVLPSHLTSDVESTFAWAGDKLRFAESFVYSFIGDYPRAEEAQRLAIGLYPTTYVRGPAQIELQRALCLAKAGDFVQAVVHARETMTALPKLNYIQPLVDLGRRVLAAIPPANDSHPEVREYRDFLHASAVIGA